jgi:hypothetical protein
MRQLNLLLKQGEESEKRVSNLDLESTTLKNKNKKRKNNIMHAQTTRLKEGKIQKLVGS